MFLSRPLPRLAWLRWAEGRVGCYWSARATASNQRAQGGHATGQQLKERVAFYQGLCWIPSCGHIYNVLDHVIPVSRGGSAFPANLRPICWYHNRLKRNLPPGEFLARLQDLEARDPRSRYTDAPPRADLYPFLSRPPTFSSVPVRPELTPIERTGPNGTGKCS